MLLRNWVSRVREKNGLKMSLRDIFSPFFFPYLFSFSIFFEGLETSEKHLGWSARSGKVVLRIALQRLHRYYDDLNARGGGMIG